MAVERLIRLSVAGGSPALTDSCCTARSWRRGTRGAPAPRSSRHAAARSARGQRLALSLAGTVAPGLRKIHPTTPVANAQSAGVHAPRVAGVGLPRIWTRCAVLARAPSRLRRVRQLSGRIAATRSAPTASLSFDRRSTAGRVAGQFRDSGLVSWMRAAGHGVTALGLASGCGSGDRDEASVLAGPHPDCHSTVALQRRRAPRLRLATTARAFARRPTGPAAGAVPCRFSPGVPAGTASQASGREPGSLLVRAARPMHIGVVTPKGRSCAVLAHGAGPCW
jgi:hypothetical protein